MQVQFTNTDKTAGTVDGRAFTISATGNIWVNRSKASKAVAEAINAAKAEAAKPAAKKAAPAGGRAPTLADDSKITLLVKENPKREGSAGYERFQAGYIDSKAKTVQQALDAGVTLADIAYDVKKEFIKLG